MTPSRKSDSKIAANRKALREYSVLERYEAGIQLLGTEVKSARLGHVTLTGSYAAEEGGELFLYGTRIEPYEQGNRFNHDPDRRRRLLLHRREIRSLTAQADQKGYALIPLNMYLRRGRVKLEIGLCRGKAQHDKRETLRRRTAERDAARAVAAHAGRQRAR